MRIFRIQTSEVTADRTSIKIDAGGVGEGGGPAGDENGGKATERHDER